MSTVQDRLEQASIILPKAPTPAANYLPYLLEGNMLYISGQIPRAGDQLLTGKIGVDATIDDGIKAARLCAINIIAQANTALDGKLERIKQCIKLGGFVNATDDFSAHPQVINGASDLMVEIFGDEGRHTRFAIGAGSLPLNVTVEIDAVFAIK